MIRLLVFCFFYVFLNSAYAQVDETIKKTISKISGAEQALKQVSDAKSAADKALHEDDGAIPTPLPTQLQLPDATLNTKPANTEFRLGERDPFAPPKYIKEKLLVKPEEVIDSQMEAIRRWPLSDYRLKGVIWDVKNPKAMIVDKVNTLHLLKKNYRIGNHEGIISQINESEIIVVQKGVPAVLTIDRSGAGASTGAGTR